EYRLLIENGQGQGQHEATRGDPGGHYEGGSSRSPAADDAVPAPSLAGVSTGARPARPTAADAAYPALALRRASVRSRPRSSMLSKRPGETFEPVTATRIGWKP